LRSTEEAAEGISSAEPGTAFGCCKFPVAHWRKQTAHRSLLFLHD